LLDRHVDHRLFNFRAVRFFNNTASPKARTSFFAQTGPMPRIIPEPRYFSIPSIDVGGAAWRNEALNWTPGCGR
jgi:hypothetical protein